MKGSLFTFIFACVMAFTMLFMGMSAFAESLPTGGSFDAPQNLTVEIKEWEDGRPYFMFKWTNPKSIWELERYGAEHGEWGAGYQIDMKVGDEQWCYDMGESIYGGGISFDEDDDPENFITYDVTCDPIDLGVGDSVDIRENVYHFRVRYAYEDNQGSDDIEHYIYSQFSNTASIGTEAFYMEASNWAEPELKKANSLGLIPDILQGADMTKPITREEFAELVVLLYEKVTGKKSEPVSPNPFTDTTNPQILKAYKLGITSGTSQTTFSPKVLINREQCATMLFRAIKAIHPAGDYSITGVKDFPDQKHISSWAVEATKYMNKIGVIAGDARGNFMPKATTPAQEATGYGMATREQAIALSVRTYDKAPEITSSGSNSPETGGTEAKLPDGFPSDLIQIYEGGKITKVEEKTFAGGYKGYLITVDHAGQKDSEVNGFYYTVMANAESLDAMIGMHSYYYGTKDGYWVEIDFYQELGDEYKGYATIGYYNEE